MVQNSAEYIPTTNKRKKKLNELTEKQQINFIDFDEIKKINVDTLEEQFIKDLYTQIPPRRLEYKDLIISNIDDNKNNIILINKDNEPEYIILNKYKTFKTYGKYTINLNDNKQLKVSTYNFIKNKKIDEFIFKDRNKFYEKLYKTFKGNISCNILRHSYITKYLSDKNILNITDKELSKQAEQMGHSVNMFLTYRKCIK